MPGKRRHAAESSEKIHIACIASELGSSVIEFQSQKTTAADERTVATAFQGLVRGKAARVNQAQRRWVDPLFLPSPTLAVLLPKYIDLLFAVTKTRL